MFSGSREFRVFEEMHQKRRAEWWIQFWRVGRPVPIFIVSGWRWNFIYLLDIYQLILIELKPDKFNALQSPERDPSPPAFSKDFVFVVEEGEEFLVCVNVAYIWLSKFHYSAPIPSLWQSKR